MGKSQTLRLRDVRAVYRLLGECRELGMDADAWRRQGSSPNRKLVIVP